jgi:ribosomal protein S27E
MSTGSLRTRGERGIRHLVLEVEASAEQRRTERRAARIQFRLYCFACGRSETVASPPARPGRCLNCGGTMLTEFDPT